MYMYIYHVLHLSFNMSGIWVCEYMALSSLASSLIIVSNVKPQRGIQVFNREVQTGANLTILEYSCSTLGLALGLAVSLLV